MSRTIARGLLAMCLGASPSIAWADHPAEYAALTCSFQRLMVNEEANGDWTSKERGTDNFVLIYAAINIKDGTAQLIGNAGASDVAVFPANESLHLLEFTGTGNLTITTVFNGPRLGEFMAVHARHMALKGPLVSQYFGTCSGKR